MRKPGSEMFWKSREENFSEMSKWPNVSNAT